MKSAKAQMYLNLIYAHKTLYCTNFNELQGSVYKPNGYI